MIQIGNSGTMTNVFYSERIANNHLRKPTIQVMRSGKNVSHGTGCSSVISIQIDKIIDTSTTVSIFSYDIDHDTPVTDVKTLSQLNSTTWIQDTLYGGVSLPYNLDTQKTVMLMEVVAEESVSIPKVYFVGFYDGHYQKLDPTANCLYGIKISCSNSKVLDYELYNYDTIQNGAMVIDFSGRSEIKMICGDFSTAGFETNNRNYICGYMITGQDNTPARALTTLFHAYDDANDTYAIHIGTLNNIKIPGTSSKFGETVLAENVDNFWDNGKAVAEYDVSEVDTASIQHQVNELEDTINDLGYSITEIQGEIDDIPSQIETAIDEATASIMSEQAQMFVAR